MFFRSQDANMNNILETFSFSINNSALNFLNCGIFLSVFQLDYQFSEFLQNSFYFPVPLTHYFLHLKKLLLQLQKGFPGYRDGKESAHNVGDPVSVPGLRRSSGEGNGNPLQYSCLENCMDRGAWRATVHRVTKSQTQLSVQVFDEFQRCVCVCVAPACSVMPNSVHGIFQARILERGCHFLLQEIFQTQGSNPVSYVSCLGSRFLYQQRHLG